MRTEERKVDWKAWYLLALLVIVAILNYLDRNMIATMRLSIIDSIPMSDAQFGFLTTVFSWVYGIFCPVAGFLADRFKKSYLIIGSLFVWSTVTLLTGYVTTYEQLFAARAMMGISEAFFIPAALSMIMDCHKNPSLAIGILFAGEMFGSSFGYLGGEIAELHSWNYAFHLFGWIGIVYAVILIFTLREVTGNPVKKVAITSVGEDKPETPKISIGTMVMALFGKRSFYYMLLIYPLPTIVSWMVVVWLPTYYQETFDLTQSVAGKYATLPLYLASIGGLVLGGFLTDKWQKIFPYARIVVPIIGFAVATPCIFMVGYIHILWVAVALFAVYGFARMFIDANLMPILCMLIDTRYRATAYGIINMLTVFVGGMSAYVAGALHDAQVSLGTVFQYASLGLVICVVLLLLVKREVKKNNALPS